MLFLPVLCWTAVHGMLTHIVFPQHQTPAYENDSKSGGGNKTQTKNTTTKNKTKQNQAVTNPVNIFTAELTCRVSN